MKDIRRLIDNGEFIANKHCSSPDVRLIVTLLLELTTDHTREVERYIHVCIYTQLPHCTYENAIVGHVCQHHIRRILC